jgi:gamma-glutamylcyclotransferase (GGCT)/AIG2-like uncharacterized protein YtfP
MPAPKDPVHSFVQSHLDDVLHTHDTTALFRHRWHAVFVYGTLRKGFYRHRYMAKAHYLGTAWSRNTGYTMYIKRGVSPYPVIFPCINEPPGSIMGEVYLVPPKTILDLDFIEQNGVQYFRTYKTYDIHSRNEQPGSRTIAAWTYISSRDKWSDQLANKQMIQAQVFRRKDTKADYYLFTKEQQENAALRNL